MAKLMKICPVCDTEFTPYQRKRGGVVLREQVYCSRTCWLGKYNVENLDGHSTRGSAAAGVANAANLRGTSRGGNAYVKEGQRHQHRVVAERELGRSLDESEIVHHVDEDRKNNDPSNLWVFPSQGEHFKHHIHLKNGGECRCSFIRIKK